MSYDVTLTMPDEHDCDCVYCIYESPTVYDANYTSNVAGMWTKALGCSLRDLHGEKARDIAPKLEQAVAAFHADPEVYKAMEPANGWGKAYGAFAFLEDLRDACLRDPETIFEVWS